MQDRFSGQRGSSGTSHLHDEETTGMLAQVTLMSAQLPRPGIPPAQPPKGPKHNGHKPGEKPPHPDTGQKPNKPKPRGNGHKPKKPKSR
jgi:hypothetical protein